MKMRRGAAMRREAMRSAANLCGAKRSRQLLRQLAFFSTTFEGQV
mgnify:CR=1 FL=1